MSSSSPLSANEYQQPRVGGNGCDRLWLPLRTMILTDGKKMARMEAMVKEMEEIYDPKTCKTALYHRRRDACCGAEGLLDRGWMLEKLGSQHRISPFVSGKRASSIYIPPSFSSRSGSRSLLGKRTDRSLDEFIHPQSSVMLHLYHSPPEDIPPDNPIGSITSTGVSILFSPRQKLSFEFPEDKNQESPH